MITEHRHVNPNYDSIAPRYDRRYLENDYSGIEKALIAFVGPDSGRVLEVGCGTGHWLRLVDERGNRVAGVDASEHMLIYAHAQAPGAALARGRAEDLPWATEAFARVFCVNALHHFEDKVRFLAEARRVLEPGGQIMTVGLDPHTGLDRWYIYEYFELFSRSIGVDIPHRVKFVSGCSASSSRTCERARCSTCRCSFQRGRRSSEGVSTRV